LQVGSCRFCFLDALSDSFADLADVPRPKGFHHVRIVFVGFVETRQLVDHVIAFRNADLIADRRVNGLVDDALVRAVPDLPDKGLGLVQPRTATTNVMTASADIKGFS
jgi:hypothetical protein